MSTTRRNFIKLLSGALIGLPYILRSAAASGNTTNKTGAGVGCGKMTNVDLRKFYTNR